MDHNLPDERSATGQASTAHLDPTLKKRHGIGLFWRTFFLLSVLLVCSIIVALQAVRAMEFEPRALHTAQQVASLVTISQAALAHANPVARQSLIELLEHEEGVRFVPRAPSDQFELLNREKLSTAVQEVLTQRLGKTALVAQSVNGENGLWVSLNINGNPSWVQMDISRLTPMGTRTWLIWLVTGGALALLGAAEMARRIHQPLRQLSYAASRVQDGDFDTHPLDENAATREIRDVNIGFNRMAHKLAKLEQDRAVMLAGISHDLRTPLARLRLETEMSVVDEIAREHMVADIVQLDATIDKFLDYARPDRVVLAPVNLHAVTAACVYAVQDHRELQITMDVPAQFFVMADEVELARVVSNLLENARRYGKTGNSRAAHVDIDARELDDWVHLRVRDHGTGVPPDQLSQLTQPFFRGDAARTAATGAGLGLSIVDKSVRRMGGIFSLANASPSGLAAHLQLRRAPGTTADAEAPRLQRPMTKRNSPPHA